MSKNISGRRKRKNENRGTLDPDRPALHGEMVTRGFPQQYGSIPTIKNEFPDNNMASMIPTYPITYIKQEIPESYDLANFEYPYGYNSYIEDIKPDLPMLTDGIHSSYLNELEVPTQQCKVDPNDIKTIYKCCNIKFYDKFLHFRHMIDHLEKDLMRASCWCCHRTFNTRADMLRHAKTTHIGFKCKKCPLIFPKKYFLTHHMEIAHPEEPRRMNYNYYQHKKNHWHKKVKKIANYKTKGKRAFDPKFSYRKMEPIQSNSKTSGTKIKIEKTNETGLANVKIEPDISNVKQEPMSFNIKMEPMCLNIKQEPTY